RIEQAIELKTLSIFVIRTDFARFSEIVPSFLRLNVSFRFEFSDGGKLTDVPLITFSAYRAFLERNTNIKYIHIDGFKFTQEEIDHFGQYFRDHVSVERVCIYEVRETVASTMCKNVMGVDPHMFTNESKQIQTTALKGAEV
ncbi:hypothetical protein PFISCL1PPCAC_21643, partial [Pristionchus fissidentatus]